MESESKWLLTDEEKRPVYRNINTQFNGAKN